MPVRPITLEEKAYADELLRKAHCALKEIENYDQTRVDRLCQAIGWATANAKTFTRIAQMGVDESGLGDRGRVSNDSDRGICAMCCARRASDYRRFRKRNRQICQAVGVVASIIQRRTELTCPAWASAMKCRDR
jgi:sulfoacetaldehyde dehydrogenase